MKRTFLVVCALTALVALPAHADGRIIGYVDAAVTHPAVPRTAYNQSEKLNGVFGYVAEIGASASERPFTLTRLTGATGSEDLDVWFYRDISGTGDPCPRIIAQEWAGGERGTICAGAAYAVVVLFTGGDADFSLTIG